MATKITDTLIEVEASDELHVWADYIDLEAIERIEGVDVVDDLERFTHKGRVIGYASIFIDPRYALEELKREITTCIHAGKGGDR